MSEFTIGIGQKLKHPHPFPGLPATDRGTARSSVLCLVKVGHVWTHKRRHGSP